MCSSLPVYLFPLLERACYGGVAIRFRPYGAAAPTLRPVQHRSPLCAAMPEINMASQSLVPQLVFASLAPGRFTSPAPALKFFFLLMQPPQPSQSRFAVPHKSHL